MNLRRAAAALRELAAALEDGDDEAPASDRAPTPTKKKNNRRRGPASVGMPEDVTDLDIARARRTARRIGIRVEG